jgi:hypothetical protein
MPTLAPPPTPSLTPAPSQEIGSPPVSFLGRSLADYTQSFDVDIAALRGRDVLDVGAGASSFTAETCARKVNAVAVDPRYNTPVAQLTAQVERDHAEAFAELRAKRRMLRPKSFATLEAAHLDQRSASQRFLTDYDTHFIHNRYVTGSLPKLPFFDGTFDLVLCANVLFADAKRFDYDWHLAACRELVRVSADTAKVFPLFSGEGKTPVSLPRLRRELRESGIVSEVRAVNREFIVGPASMLVLRKSAP